MEKDSSNSSSSDSEEDFTDEDERSKIRNDLSTMSFEDLQKLKDKIGSKLFNKAISKTTENDNNDKKPKKRSFKRANKNRPREESAKRRPKNFLPAVRIKDEPRDPRFDPLCGSFDDKIFQQNYRFINDLRVKERKEIEKMRKTTTDEKEAKKLNYIAQRLDNQIREHDKKMKVEEEKFVERQEIREKLKRGERPYFKKKSVKKLETLVHQYEDLKKTNRVEKHIMKRSKKLQRKDKKQLGKDNFV